MQACQIPAPRRWAGRRMRSLREAWTEITRQGQRKGDAENQEQTGLQVTFFGKAEAEGISFLSCAPGAIGCCISPSPLPWKPSENLVSRWKYTTSAMTPLWFGMPFIQFRNLGQPNSFLDILLKMSKIVFGRGGRRNPFVFMCLFVCLYVLMSILMPVKVRGFPGAWCSIQAVVNSESELRKTS